MSIRRHSSQLAAAIAGALILAAAPVQAQHTGHPVTKSEKPQPAQGAGHGAGHGAAHGAGMGAGKGMQGHMSGWRALDDYHMVMMQVWHPAKQGNDLAPVRAKADTLAAKADAWAAAEVPAACDSPATREAVAQIRTDSHALAALVKTGTDAEIKAALSALHDRFEPVNHGCKVPAKP